MGMVGRRAVIVVARRVVESREMIAAVSRRAKSESCPAAVSAIPYPPGREAASTGRLGLFDTWRFAGKPMVMHCE